MIKGRLTRWNAGKGYGFMTTEALEQDLFVHISAFKTANRPPRVGDMIYCNVEKQADGKKRAINCEIEGLTSSQPDNSLANKTSPTPSTTPLFSAVILGAIGLFIYQNSGYRQSGYPTDSLSISALPPVPQASGLPDSLPEQDSFSCDGRQYCAQMHSRAEAVFFITHCPDTLMDGDGDGIPCENDSRF